MKRENKTTSFPEGLFKNYFGDDRIADLKRDNLAETKNTPAPEPTKAIKQVDCGPGKPCS